MHKAIEINPSNAPALNYLGYTYAEVRHPPDEAEKLIKRALDIEPEDGFYIDSLGWVYYQQGEYRKRSSELERAVNLTGNDPTITEHLGDAYSKIGKPSDARRQYEDALKRTQEAEQIQRLKNKIPALRDAGEQRVSNTARTASAGDARCRGALAWPRRSAAVALAPERVRDAAAAHYPPPYAGTSMLTVALVERDSDAALDASGGDDGVSRGGQHFKAREKIVLAVRPACGSR